MKKTHNHNTFSHEEGEGVDADIGRTGGLDTQGHVTDSQYLDDGDDCGQDDEDSVGDGDDCNGDI